ncbi:hypothetical protein OO010_06975 [Flavobacteriaceae bacterium KMM 6898]|nr:hypothetical protein [Flavobacteriaceae bacterium KMM 6898]
MKNLKILIFLLFSIGVLAQNKSKINADLKLSDSLNYETEVRIYKSEGTYHSSLFRMYKDNSGKWNTEFYEHSNNVNEFTELLTEKRTLISKNDVESVFLSLVRNYIFELPNIDQIEHKLDNRGNIKKVGITDRDEFKIQAKNKDKNNEFQISNPDNYLINNPKIDELIYMSEILNTIRNEFEIWKE